MKKRINLVIVFLLSMILAACATTPTWKDISESDIAKWQELGLDARDAQDFKNAGLGPDDIKGWYGVGFKEKEKILSWHRSDFKFDEAAAWSQQNFSAQDAATWKEHKFSADEAGKWKNMKFDLSDAIKNREKGLQPIQK